MSRVKQILDKSILIFILKFIGKNRILEILLDSSEKEVLNYVNSGFLVQNGWWKSWKAKEPLDSQNKPIPWVTYSFLNFIDKRIQNGFILFEFGSGNSTLYYSRKVKEVYSVEHDILWYNKIKNMLPANVKIKYIELQIGAEYCKSVINSGRKYDMIIVDGRDRVNCLVNSINSVKKDGVIILDDSERKEYTEGIIKLKKYGFKSLDFWGISPGFMAYNKCTTIYYRDENVLDI